MEQISLFDDNKNQSIPLANRLRPETLEEFAGQEHLLGKGKMLRQLIERDQISSMIFWGPPGVGKTTLASIIANRTRSNFINFSAVTSGIKEIKDVMKEADENRHWGFGRFFLWTRFIGLTVRSRMRFFLLWRREVLY